MKTKHIVEYSTENAAYVEGAKMERVVQVLIVIALIAYWVF